MSVGAVGGNNGNIRDSNDNAIETSFATGNSDGEVTVVDLGAGDASALAKIPKVELITTITHLILNATLLNLTKDRYLK